MYGCFQCCLQQPQHLCPHDDYRGEAVVQETEDPSLPYEEQMALKADDAFYHITSSTDPKVMQVERNHIINDDKNHRKNHLRGYVADNGESRLALEENKFFVSSKPPFPTRDEFSTAQYELGYPTVLPKSLDTKDPDNQYVLVKQSDPNSLKHHIDFCSEILMPSDLRGVKQREARVVDRTQGTTTTMRVLTLNMGDWQRKPRVAGGHELGPEYMFRHRLIFNHSFHIVSIVEADKLTQPMLEEIMNQGFTGICFPIAERRQ